MEHWLQIGSNAAGDLFRFSIGQLSELRFLTLWREVYSWGEEMKFRGDEFKQLQELNLAYLDQLERMIVEDGAMPRLQKLKIFYCQKLKTIPPRLEDLVLRV